MNDIQFHPDWEPLAAYSPSLRIPAPLEDESIPVVIAEDDPVSRRLVTTIIEMGAIAPSSLKTATKRCLPCGRKRSRASQWLTG